MIFSVTCLPNRLHRRQGRAALALADLLTEELPALLWHVQAAEHTAGSLLGIRDDGDPAGRVDAVDEWARRLGVTPSWEKLAGRGGEYRATGWHLGARVVVRAWLEESPLEVNA
ncbi:hypothetical protein AB0F88_17265 [Streptosporangium sp. NPDC023963]|uniref:hypothetical protein n=1 Tax=Streptosporangium sp. NPDC023963 TaxID=3155608 RepID=UPI0034128317